MPYAIMGVFKLRCPRNYIELCGNKIRANGGRTVFDGCAHHCGFLTPPATRSTPLWSRMGVGKGCGGETIAVSGHNENLFHITVKIELLTSVIG